MTTATDIDVAALVGEMEALPCEHSQHGTGHPSHDDGPATHYAQGFCTSCSAAWGLYPACARFVATVRSNDTGECGKCGHIGALSEFVRILGPVGQ